MVIRMTFKAAERARAGKQAKQVKQGVSAKQRIQAECRTKEADLSEQAKQDTNNKTKK